MKKIGPFNFLIFYNDYLTKPGVYAHLVMRMVGIRHRFSPS